MDGGDARAVLVGHRRWGKDDVALHLTAVASQKRIGNYWHMLPEYGQARKAVWDAVNPRTGKRRIDEAFPEAIRKQTRKQEMLIEMKSGSVWQLVGSDNYNSLVGSPPIGVIFSEYSIANPLAWAYIRPILAENRGFALFIYTSRGDNHGKKLYEMARDSMRRDGDWYAEVCPVYKTDVFTEKMLERELRELVLEWGPEEGEAIYNQEYLCSFDGAIAGSYYSRVVNAAIREGRVRFVPYLIGHEVYTFWDLGMDDSTTIWFAQMVGDEIRFIDYYENSRQSLDHYAQVLLNEKKYLYGDHYMPHDATSQSLQTGESVQEFAEGLGIKPVITVERPKNTAAVIAGINQGRRVFNRCFFDENKCEAGLAALSAYRSGYDKKKRKMGTRPIHDWTSHAADAFRTFAMGWEPRTVVKTVGSVMDDIYARVLRGAREA